MRRVLAGIVTFFAISLSGSAQATEVCAAGMICASNPQSVAKALQDLGYKALLTKDNDGDPMVSSAAGGYDYDVLFYGCEKAVECKSLSFSVTFKKDSANTPDLANLWNKQQRFSTMSVTDSGSLVIEYDVTTVGGLNKANFGEVVSWWDSALSHASDFFKEHPADADSASAK